MSRFLGSHRKTTYAKTITEAAELAEGPGRWSRCRGDLVWKVTSPGQKGRGQRSQTHARKNLQMLRFHSGPRKLTVLFAGLRNDRVKLSSQTLPMSAFPLLMSPDFSCKSWSGGWRKAAPREE